MTNGDAKYIWIDKEGPKYNEYVLFRKAYVLEGEPLSGTLNIFADTRYRLLVNGVTVGHGPARFFKSHPEYDVHEISRHLRRGENVIAVTVNSYQGSFHSEASRGGLIAWGRLRSEDTDALKIATDESWKVLRSPMHVSETMRLTFALNQAEVFHAEREPRGWSLHGFGDDEWESASALPDPGNWGELRPRSIPLLDESPIESGLAGLFRANFFDDIKTFSFAICGNTGEGFRAERRGYAYTYIFSNTGCETEFYINWNAEVYVNGSRARMFDVASHAMCKKFPVLLKKGWNQLFFDCRVRSDVHHVFVGIPEKSGLRISAEKDASSEPAFNVTGLFTLKDAGVFDPAELASANSIDFQAIPLDWKICAKAENPHLEHVWKEFSSVNGLADFCARDVGTRVYIYDFGTELIGRAFLDIDAEQGVTVDVLYSEKLEKGLSPLDISNFSPIADRFVSGGGGENWQAFHPRGFRYLQIMVTGADDKFELRKVFATRANYPHFQEGSFACPDKLLSQIWKMGRDTLDACMEDAYLDCPTRERGLYSGDLLVQFLTDMAVFGDPRLQRRCIDIYLQAQGENGFVPGGAHGLPPGRHADYTAILVISLYEYYAATGDADFTQYCMPRIKKLLKALLSLTDPHTGLADGTGYSPYIDRGHTRKEGVSCALNCFIYGAFDSASRLCSAIGDSAAKEEYARTAERIAGLVNEYFFDKEQGLYSDLLKSDDPSREASVQGNTLPLYFGFNPAGTEREILDFVEEKIMNNFRVPDPENTGQLNVNAYFSFYVMEILFRNGRGEPALDFVRKYWGRMIENGAWTCWEFFIDLRGASRCHAWAASPTLHMSRYLLGLRFPEPGNRSRVLVDPIPCGMDSARGVHPHPEGEILISWTADSAEGICVQCRAPEAVEILTGENVTKIDISRTEK